MLSIRLPNTETINSYVWQKYTCINFNNINFSKTFHKCTNYKKINLILIFNVCNIQSCRYSYLMIYLVKLLLKNTGGSFYFFFFLGLDFMEHIKYFCKKYCKFPLVHSSEILYRDINGQN